jgi:hypothetical protein
MNHNKVALRRSILIGALAFFVLIISSCGNSSSDTTTAPARDQATSYLGTNSFNNGQTGTLSFTVSGNGSAAGTFRVTNDVNPQTVITVGTYDVTGTGSLITGTFSLSGTLPVLGEFIITGSLPQSGNQTTYVVSVNNETFQGTLEESTQADTGETQVIQGGTVNSLNFQFSNDFNGDQPPVDAQSTISGAFGPGANGEQSLSIALSEIIVGGDTQTNLLTVSIVDPNGQALVVNQAYDVVVSNTAAGSFATLSELLGTNTTPERNWVSEGQTSTGTATITSLTDTNVTLDFNLNNVIPNSELTGNMAVGTFNVSGSITGNFATTN